MFFPYAFNNYFVPYPFFPPNCDKPPTIYSILNSIVNGEKEEDDYTKIVDLADEGRGTIFDFNYPLSSKITKKDFECMILNHYMMRRIGFETVTAFKLQLNVKLNSIMPLFNKMFDAIDNWDIFSDGEKETRYGRDDRTSESTTENTLTSQSATTSDRRFSDSPQNELSNVRDGKYITEYNYDSNNDTSNSNGESTNNIEESKEFAETTERTATNKIEILKELQENIKSIYQLIFDELDILFYGLV